MIRSAAIIAATLSLAPLPVLADGPVSFTCIATGLGMFPEGNDDFNRMGMIYTITVEGDTLSVMVDVPGDEPWGFEETYTHLREDSEEAYWTRTDSMMNGHLALPPNATLLALRPGQSFPASIVMQHRTFANATFYDCTHAAP